MFSRFARAPLFLALSAFLILASARPHAAAPITGRVVDEAGRPVPGARVFVSSGATATTSAETDSDGRFTLQPIGDGRATVRVALDGFRAEAVTVESTTAPRDLGTMTLKVSAISEAIVVSANQVEVPLSEVASSVTVIEDADIEARQIHSVADALRSVPGLTVVSTGGLGATTGVFPRGGESNYTLVVVDGVPANAFGGDYDFGHLPAANIDRVEIVRGPQSALFGANAIGSVVRVVSQRGGAPTGQFLVEAGAYDTSRVSGSTAGSYRAFEWGGYFDQLLSDGMNGEPTASRRRRRQRRLHAAIGGRLAGVAQQRVVAACRRAVYRRRARLSRSVRQQPDRQLRRDRSGVARREFAHAGGCGLVVAALRARPAAGADELQPDRKRLRQPLRYVRQLLAALDGPRAVRLPRPAGIGSVGGHGAPA